MSGRTQHDDAGVSLVELIVAIVISGLFAGMLVIMFVNGWNAQEKSVARDSATGQANVLRATMSESLRNATALRVSGAGTRVDAVVAKPTASFTGTWQWECRAWAFTDQSIRYATSSSQLGADTDTWHVLVGKSSQRPTDKVGPPTGGVPFTLMGTKGVQISLDITVGAEQKTVRLSDGMTPQAVAQTGAIECW